jgi:transposase
VALSNQIQGHLDLVFPGLGACFGGILATKAGRVLVRDIADPDRMRRLGVEGLVGFVARRGVQLRRPKAEQLLEAARVALRLPASERAPVAALLAADVALLDALDTEIDRAEAALAGVLGETPAGVLTSLPGVGIVRASAYGAAIGDPDRFPNAAAAYRASGLVPAEYSSAGRSRGGQHISREGSVELRTAIIELGRGLAGHEADFAAYRRRLRSDGKRPMVAAVAVGHRAHRLAFAMLRTQEPYDPHRWAAAVADGPVMAKTGGRPTRTT